MAETSAGEIIFYFILFASNMVLVTQFAKHGVELGVQVPPNFKAIGAFFIGLTSYMVAGYLQKYGVFQFELLTKAFYSYSIVLFLVIPLVWLLFCRAFFSRNGVFDYNRARARTMFWSIKAFRPGQKLDEEAGLLKKFDCALNAVKFFERSIEAQKKGTKQNYFKRIVEIDEEQADYYGNIHVQCGGCFMRISVPLKVLSYGGSANCGVCGSRNTVKRVGDKIHIYTFTMKPFCTVTDRNKSNIAVAYQEMGFLYRMMNHFQESEEFYGQAENIINELLAKNNSKEYMATKSLILFRKGELCHVLGLKEKARQYYSESMDIDNKTGNNKDNDFIKSLIKQLN